MLIFLGRHKNMLTQACFCKKSRSSIDGLMTGVLILDYYEENSEGEHSLFTKFTTN